MNKKEWFKREFKLQLDPGTFPGILERLMGTPARLEEKIKDFPKELLHLKRENEWSAQENVGHLGDLEPIWLQRVKDILEGKTYLSEADLTNRKTHEAGHNTQSLDELLQTFRQRRRELVRALSGVGGEEVEKTALHPRLKTPMKLIDLAYFVAEHDDHHLAQITTMKKKEGRKVGR